MLKERKIVLIDYENIQPKSVVSLADKNCAVYIFTGKTQVKMPIELAVSMQDLGSKGKYIITNHNGKNALDFHIAYYVGKITEELKDEKLSFCVISKDKGYDGLISFLKSNKISIARYSDVESVFASTKANISVNTKTTTKKAENCISKESIDEKVKKVTIHLNQNPNSKPKTESGLRNKILHGFGTAFSGSDATEIINFMKKQKIITIKNKKVSYQISKKIVQSNEKKSDEVFNEDIERAEKYLRILGMPISAPRNPFVI